VTLYKLTAPVLKQKEWVRCKWSRFSWCSSI